MRLIWERDGTELLDTVARDWVDRDVLIDIDDDRWISHGVWLDAEGVTRRPDPIRRAETAPRPCAGPA